jgi:rhodanese-related sulfurtransferase
MSKPRTKELSNLPLIVGGILVAALLGFAIWRMTRTAATPLTTPVAQTSSSAPVQAPLENPDAARAAVPRMSVTELRDRLAKNEVTVIDVRDADAYLETHIPGSMHIPLARIDGEIPYLPKGKPIVTYCTCPHDEAAADADMILTHGGIPNAFALAGGLGAWQADGLPTQAGD